MPTLTPEPLCQKVGELLGQAHGIATALETLGWHMADGEDPATMSFAIFGALGGLKTVIGLADQANSELANALHRQGNGLPKPEKEPRHGTH